MVASRGAESMSLCALSFTPVVAGPQERSGGAASRVSSYSEFIGVRVHHHNPRGTTAALECK